MKKSIVKEICCPECGAVNSDEDLFCVECGCANSGKIIVHANIQEQEDSSFSTKPEKENGRIKHRFRKLIIFFFVATILVVSAFILNQIFFREGNHVPDTTQGSTGNTSEALSATSDSQPITSSQILNPFELPEYPVSGLVDGDIQSSWGSKLNERGEGGKATIPYGRKMVIYGINVQNGCWNSQYNLLRNGRVKKLLIEFDDGSEEILLLSDPSLELYQDVLNSGGEKFYFSKPHTITEMKLSIIDVYPGAEDTVFITGIDGIFSPLENNIQEEEVFTLTERDSSKIYSVLASSENMDASGHVFSKSNLTNSDNKMVWGEGVPGAGIGEWIELHFSETLYIDSLVIFNGHSASRSVYDEYGKVKKILIEFSDGSRVEEELITDSYNYQMISFSTPVKAHSVKLTILAAIPGTEHDVTCVSQVYINEKVVLQRDVSLFDLTALSENGWKPNVLSPIDAQGNFQEFSTSYLVVGNGNYAEYDVGGHFTKLTGRLVGHKQMVEDGAAVLCIYADNRAIFSSSSIDKYSDLEFISVDITGVKNLRIEIIGTAGTKNRWVLFLDPMLLVE